MVSKKIVLDLMEGLAPLKLAMDWDNCGMLVDVNNEISGILVCLDVTKAVVDEAKNKNCNLIISHHPVIFEKLSTISNNDVVYHAIKNNISVYSAHTNMDISKKGLNDALSDMLELKNVENLDLISELKLKKIIVYTPSDNKEKVKQAMFDIGAGKIGEYSECSFESNGIGNFKPSENANPYIGEKNKRTTVDEIRVECICDNENLSEVIEAIKQAHSYEKPAIDVVSLDYPAKTYALGRIGFLKNMMTLKEFCDFIKNKLDIDFIRVSGDLNKKVTKAALCCGSCGDLYPISKSKGADVLISGDIRHNHYIDAANIGIYLIDAGHYHSEKQFLEIVIKSLQQSFDSIQYNVAVSRSEVETCPYKVL